MDKNNNYIVEWYKKFGEDVIKKWMNEYSISVNSHIFKFKPGNLLDKILNVEDLFAFSKYINGDYERPIASYYSSMCNSFYQEKNKITVEDILEESSESSDEQMINLIWENVMDMSESLVVIQQSNKKISDLHELTKQTHEIINKLNTSKTEKNAKYSQLEEVKTVISELKDEFEKNGYKPIKKNNKLRNEFIFGAVIVVIAFLLGGLVL